MDTKTFIKTINDLRLKNKNKWYFWEGIVNEKHIQIKAYDTWTQIFRVNGINHGGTMDISPTNFKKHLEVVANS